MNCGFPFRVTQPRCQYRISFIHQDIQVKTYLEGSEYCRNSILRHDLTLRCIQKGRQIELKEDRQEEHPSAVPIQRF